MWHFTCERLGAKKQAGLQAVLMIFLQKSKQILFKAIICVFFFLFVHIYIR